MGYRPAIPTAKWPGFQQQEWPLQGIIVDLDEENHENNKNNLYNIYQNQIIDFYSPYLYHRPLKNRPCHHVVPESHISGGSS